MPNFAKRRIDVTINLGEGQFGEDKGKDVTLTGLRVSAKIVYYKGAVQGSAQIRIFGLPLSMINQLTGTGIGALEVRRNTILIAAGDKDGKMSTIYQGQIRYAYGDFGGAPDSALDIIALAVATDAVKPVDASSYRGDVDAAVIMSDLAKKLGLTFENNGVSVMLSNPYFPGTAWQQIMDCGEAAGIDYTIDRGILAIFPKLGARTLDGPVEVSPETGMVGYPTFWDQGLAVTTLFNPNISIGGQINVVSDITVACGVWNSFNIFHTLESETPNGQWFTQIQCSRPPQ